MKTQLNNLVQMYHDTRSSTSLNTSKNPTASNEKYTKNDLNPTQKNNEIISHDNISNSINQHNHILTAYQEKCTKNDFKKTQPYFCKTCNYTTHYKSYYQKHVNTQKHKNLCDNNTKISLNHKYICELCNYLTNNQYDYIETQ